MTHDACDLSIMSHHSREARQGGQGRRLSRGLSGSGATLAALAVLLSACAQPGEPLTEEERAFLEGRSQSSGSPSATQEVADGQPFEESAAQGSAEEGAREGQGVPSELDSMSEPVGATEPDSTEQNAGAGMEAAGESGAPAQGSGNSDPDEGQPASATDEPAEGQPEDGAPGSSQSPGQPAAEAPVDAAPPAEPPPPPAPPPPPPAPPGAPLDCSNPAFLVCETFEGAAVGAFPDNEQWLEELPGCGSHTVDELLPVQSDERALRATGAAYPECMLHTDVSAEPELFVRTYVRLTEPSSESGNHVSLLELGALPSQDDPELRVGLRSAGACAEPGLDVTVGGLTTGERTACSGIALDADRWYCLEAHYRMGTESLEVELRLDGEVAVPATTFGELSESWQSGGLFLKLGRAAYGGSTTFDVFHDDIVVARSPIGCN